MADNDHDGVLDTVDAFSDDPTLGSINTLVWNQLGIDIDGEAASDYSGYSVSLSADGTIVAIGAIFYDGSKGHVRVYQYDSNSWVQMGADIDGEAANDRSGQSVSLSADGSIVAIGATWNDGTKGHVRVYEFNGTSWVQKGVDIDGEYAGDESGGSVSLSADGSIVAIGATWNDGTKGHVRVYEFNGTSWVQKGVDIDGEALYDYSGQSVSLSADGSIVAIGATGNKGVNGVDSGHVRVYEFIGTSWVQKGADIDGENAADQSGYSVSLSADGSIVAIGAPWNDGAKGHVRVYKYDDINGWVQMGVDIDGENAYDYSGRSVSLSADGSIVAIGAIYNDVNGNNSGHVRVYKYINNVWTQIGADIDGETAGDNSGHSVSLNQNGTIVAIGAKNNDENGVNSGHVRVYKLYGDEDGDGVLNVVDVFPNDASETVDTDGDGVGDNADVFPNDPTKSNNETITVKLGWNIISCTIAVDKNQIIDNSDSNIISDIWEYDELYKEHPIIDPLDPKKGYWVKCTQAGTLSFKNK